MLTLRPWQVAEPEQVNQLKSSKKDAWLIQIQDFPTTSRYISISWLVYQTKLKEWLNSH